jgi:phosphate-selective porin OprO/OprP
MRIVPITLAATLALAAPLRAQETPPDAAPALSSGSAGATRGAAPGLEPGANAVGPAAPKPVEPAAKPAEPAVGKPQSKPSSVSAGSDGFGLQSEDGEYRLQLRGYVQLDGRFFASDEGALAIDTFTIRRARPILQGSLGRYFDFSLVPDFGGGSTVLQDAYLDFKPSARLKLRFGKYKPPVGLERLQPATAISFVERAFPSALLPNRDVGVMVHGDLAGGVVSYAAGVFDGAPDGGSVDGDLNDGKDLDGRLFLSPWKRGRSRLKHLGFGIAGTTGDQTGPLPAYRSGGQISVITIVSGVTADGTRTRYSPQLSFYSGRLGLLAEYAASSSKVRNAEGTRYDLDIRAWQVAASVALTGDAASYSGLRPSKPFDPARGQWGGLELAARVHALELDAAALDAGLVDPTRSPRELSAWTVGLNWSLTRNVKLVGDFEHVSFTGGAVGRGRDAENVFFVRTQLSF